MVIRRVREAVMGRHRMPEPRPERNFETGEGDDFLGLRESARIEVPGGYKLKNSKNLTQEDAHGIAGNLSTWVTETDPGQMEVTLRQLLERGLRERMVGTESQRGLLAQYGDSNVEIARNLAHYFSGADVADKYEELQKRREGLHQLLTGHKIGERMNGTTLQNKQQVIAGIFRTMTNDRISGFKKGRFGLTVGETLRRAAHGSQNENVEFFRTRGAQAIAGGIIAEMFKHPLPPAESVRRAGSRNTGRNEPINWNGRVGVPTDEQTTQAAQETQTNPTTNPVDILLPRVAANDDVELPLQTPVAAPKKGTPHASILDAYRRGLGIERHHVAFHPGDEEPTEPREVAVREALSNEAHGHLNNFITHLKSRGVNQRLIDGILEGTLDGKSGKFPQLKYRSLNWRNWVVGTAQLLKRHGHEDIAKELRQAANAYHSNPTPLRQDIRDKYLRTINANGTQKHMVRANVTPNVALIDGLVHASGAPLTAFQKSAIGAFNLSQVAKEGVTPKQGELHESALLDLLKRHARETATRATQTGTA